MLVYNIPSWYNDTFDRQGLDPHKSLDGEVLNKTPERLVNGMFREMFGRLYSMDTMRKRPESQIASDRIARLADSIHNKLSGLDEFQTLKQEVAGDETLSALAASRIAGFAFQEATQKINQELKEVEELQEELEALEGFLDAPGEIGDHARSEYENVQARLQELDQAIDQAIEGIEHGGLIRWGEAVNEVKDQVQGAKVLAGYFPAGKEGSDLQHGYNRAMEIVEKFGNSKVKDFLKLLGRIEAIFEEVKRSVSQYKATDVVGVETGDDLFNVLPEELLLLRFRKVLFRQKYVERGLLQVERRDNETEGNGPFVVMIDISGSTSDRMKGDLTVLDYEIAFALAALKHAREQGRETAVAIFNTDVFWTNEESLVTVRDSGGTEIKTALREGIMKCKELSQEGKPADLLIITDGEDHLSENDRPEGSDDVKVISVFVQPEFAGEHVFERVRKTLETVSDHVFAAVDFMESVKGAVKAIFSEKSS